MSISNETWTSCIKKILFDAELDAVPYEDLVADIPCLGPSSDIVRGTKVLIRADLDVPLDAERKTVEDPERLASLSQTVDLCKQLQLVPVVYGHVGRDKENTALPLVAEVERLFGLKCVFVPDWMSDVTGEVPASACEQIRQAEPGTFVLLEQTRRYDLERQLWGKKGPDAPGLTGGVVFAAATSLARNVSDHFVFDALASHNPDWSSVVVPGAMKKTFLGPYTYSELAGPLKETRRSEILMLSGLKIDKLDALEAVVNRGATRVILCGGSIAMAIVKAFGRSIGQAEDPVNAGKKWYIPQDRVEQARRILEAARRNNIDISVPTDFVLDDGSVVSTIPGSRSQRDIGPESIRQFVNKIQDYVRSKTTPTTIFYNGSVGQFEAPEFAAGTRSLVEALCALAKEDARARIYVGGGDGRLTLSRFGDPSIAAHIFTSGGTVLKVIGAGNLNYLKSLYVYRHSR